MSRTSTPEASSALIVPAQQTYPIIGAQDADASGATGAGCDIVDGRLSSLNLFGTDADSPPSAELSTAAKSGTLHPLGLGGDGVGYSSSFEVEDEELDDGPLTLAQWPEPNQLTFVADRTNCHQRAPAAGTGCGSGRSDLGQPPAHGHPANPTRKGRQMMQAVIDSVITGVPAALVEIRRLGRTLKQRARDVLAYFDRPGTSNGPAEEAINGHLEHLRGSALGFRNLTNYVARSLLESGGLPRPQLHLKCDEPV